MVSLVRIIALVATLGVLVASTAVALPPSPANSTVPSCITLVGSNGGIPHAGAGLFTVVVRDIANNPLPGVAVILEFIGCTDLSLCTNQLDINATVTCNLVQKQVCKLTGPTGVVAFTVLGGSNGTGNATSLAGCVMLYANATPSCVLTGGSVLLRTPSASAADLDFANGVGVNDLSVWMGDFGSGLPWARSDFDCTGHVGVNDLSVWLAIFGSGGSAPPSCVPPC